MGLSGGPSRHGDSLPDRMCGPLGPLLTLRDRCYPAETLERARQAWEGTTWAPGQAGRPLGPRTRASLASLLPPKPAPQALPRPLQTLEPVRSSTMKFLKVSA